MTTETKPRMTVAEIALMREIVRWRKANGITYWRPHGRLLGNFVTWTEGHPWGGDNGREVAVDFKRGDDGPYMEMSVGVKGRLGGMVVDDRWSLTQAVDLLVALGYLPARFSSIYRIGYEMGGLNHWADQHSRPDPAAYADRVPAGHWYDA